MARLFVPENLTHVPLVNHLTAVRTGVEVIALPCRLGAVALPGDRRAKV